MYTVDLELMEDSRGRCSSGLFIGAFGRGGLISPATASTSATFQSRRCCRSGVTAEQPKLRESSASPLQCDLLEKAGTGNRQAEPAGQLGLIGNPACRAETMRGKKSSGGGKQEEHGPVSWFRLTNPILPREWLPSPTFLCSPNAFSFSC